MQVQFAHMWNFASGFIQYQELEIQQRAAGHPSEAGMGTRDKLKAYCQIIHYV